MYQILLEFPLKKQKIQISHEFHVKKYKHKKEFKENNSICQ